jgi:hypothetical protein
MAEQKIPEKPLVEAVMTISDAKPQTIEHNPKPDLGAKPGPAEPKPPEPTITMTQSQIAAMVATMVREQLQQQADLAAKTKAAEERQLQSLKDAEDQKQAALRAQVDPYEHVEGITLVFNRSRYPVEVVWDMRPTILPPLTVKALTDAIAYQALKVGAYKDMGTPQGVSVIVLKGDQNWGKPLSPEEQAYYEGTDPIAHSRIPLADTLTYGDKLLGSPEVVQFPTLGSPVHGPPLERDISFGAVGSKP